MSAAAGHPHDGRRPVVVAAPGVDGVPEPLQFVLNEGLQLMLIPSGGFGWVIGDRTAQVGGGGCLLSLSAASDAGVDELVEAQSFLRPLRA